jgi:hypothetical protein
MLENIKMNEKYTLVLENSLGFIVSRQVRITEANITSYAQYDKTLILVYISKGKRKRTGFFFVPDNKIAIVEGWHEVKGTFLDENINTFESFKDGDFENVLKINNLVPVYQQ